jgi:hypothetical protein
MFASGKSMWVYVHHQQEMNAWPSIGFIISEGGAAYLASADLQNYF